MPFVEVAASGTMRTSPTVPTIRYGRMRISETVSLTLAARSNAKKRRKCRAVWKKALSPSILRNWPSHPQPVIRLDGSDGQRQHEEEERQHSGRADGEVDRIGAQLAAPGVPAEEDDRHDAVEQDDRLGEPIDLHRCCLARSMRPSEGSLEYEQTIGKARAADLEVDPQVHARVQVADLLGVAVEQERRPAA